LQEFVIKLKVFAMPRPACEAQRYVLQNCPYKQKGRGVKKNYDILADNLGMKSIKL